MIHENDILHKLYRKLLTLYPRTFHELLGESMEQTFHDLWIEKRQTRNGLFGFVISTFIETMLGIVREHFIRIGEGDIMRSIPKTIGSSALISFLLILPFMIMEVVNRRIFNEDFPFMLFLVMWLNLFAIGLILLPIVRSRQTENHTMANPIPAQSNTFLTNPKSAAIISIILILFPVILSLLNTLGWVPLDRLFNGPNPEQPHVPGQIIALSLFAIPVAAGIIAGGPIVRTLRAGGRLFRHPIHLIIIVFILSTLAIGLAGLIIDQWPCFMGIPNCD